MKEKLVWEGAPSQVANLGTFVLCLLFGWLVVPLLYALWRFLEIRCTRYELTTERLRVSYGVFTRRVEELELYRVKDTALVEPFLMRLFGLGCVEITSSDPTTPRFLLTAIPGAETCRELIRTYVEVRRNRKRIHEVDMTSMSDMAWSE